jgi:hypothetical protein
MRSMTQPQKLPAALGPATLAILVVQDSIATSWLAFDQCGLSLPQALTASVPVSTITAVILDIFTSVLLGCGCS